MPTLGNALDFAKYEGRNLRAHQLGAAPSSPVTGQLYYNTADNTLYWWDSTQWVNARGGTAPDATAGTKGIIQLAGDLAGSAASPQIAAGVIVNADVNSGAAIAESKLALASDAAAGTASRRTLGTGATQAAAGNDSRFTDARAPTGAAGGDLGSTYPNPTVVKAANGFTVAAGKATITDGAQATGGLIIGADTNLYRGAADQLKTDDHFFGVRLGLGIAPSITEGRVRLPAGTTKADGISFGDEIWMYNEGTATLKINGALHVNGGIDADGALVRNVSDPSLASDAANKGYVDNAVQGLDAKQSCRVASTGNQTLPGPTTSYSIDGVALANGDRVLLKQQTTSSQNGIYVFRTGVGLSRADDLDSVPEFPGAYTWVTEGTTQADTGWVCTNDDSMVLDTTPVVWVQFSGAGQIVSGAGLTKSGNTLDVGAGAGITVNADSIQIANNGVTNAMIADGAVDLSTADVTGALPVTKGGTGATSAAAARTALGGAGYYSSATHGAGTTITITQATHALRASRGLMVQVQDEATGAVELPDIVVAANGDVTVTYGAAVTANSKRVTVIG